MRPRLALTCQCEQQPQEPLLSARYGPTLARATYSRPRDPWRRPNRQPLLRTCPWRSPHPPSTPCVPTCIPARAPACIQNDWIAARKTSTAKDRASSLSSNRGHQASTRNHLLLSPPDYSNTLSLFSLIIRWCDYTPRHPPETTCLHLQHSSLACTPPSVDSLFNSFFDEPASPRILSNPLAPTRPFPHQQTHGQIAAPYTASRFYANDHPRPTRPL